MSSPVNWIGGWVTRRTWLPSHAAPHSLPIALWLQVKGGKEGKDDTAYRSVLFPDFESTESLLHCGNSLGKI